MDNLFLADIFIGLAYRKHFPFLFCIISSQRFNIAYLYIRA